MLPGRDYELRAEGIYRQFDGLAVGSVLVGFSPGFLACFQRRATRQTFGRNQPFKGSKPMVIVMRAVIWLAAIGRSLELLGECAGPFLPGEVPLFRELHSERKHLCLPGLGKHRPAAVARKRDQSLSERGRIRRLRGS